MIGASGSMPRAQRLGGPPIARASSELQFASAARQINKILLSKPRILWWRRYSIQDTCIDSGTTNQQLKVRSRVTIVEVETQPGPFGRGIVEKRSLCGLKVFSERLAD